MEHNSRRFSASYRMAVKVYEDLDRMAPSIPDKVVQIDELQTRFHNWRVNSAVIFEEIKDLALWYTFFQSSYENLLLEIQRRHEEHARQQSIVDQFRKALADMYEEEERKRQQFFEDFGRFLPVSLCPSIVERVTRFDITPARITTKLPRVDLTEEERQQLDRLRQQMMESDSGQVGDGDTAGGAQGLQAEHDNLPDPGSPVTPIERTSPPPPDHS